MNSNLIALTTDEILAVSGNGTMNDWGYPDDGDGSVNDW